MLIGFSDGSAVASGCVLYHRICNEDESSIDVKFVAAKGKVSPIGGITTPRSELAGAVLLARLAYSVVEAMKGMELCENEYPMKLYTDSMTVLSWVNADATKFKPFVRNKVIEIQTLVESACWNYIPSKKNKPADLISKGCDRKDIGTILKGPEHMYLPEKKWPKPNFIPNKGDIELEYVSHSIASNCDIPYVNPEKFSDWNKLLRVTAYVFRFIQNVKNKNEKVRRNLINPDLDEIALAERYWIKYAQKE